MKNIIIVGVIIILSFITVVSATVNIDEDNEGTFQGVVIEIEEAITGGAIVDTNASNCAGPAEILLGNGTCSSGAFLGGGGDPDTNASTACANGEVLLGNGTCQAIINSSNFWDTLDSPADILGSLIINDFNWLNLTQILTSFWNMTQIEARYYNRTEIDDLEFVNNSFVSDNYVNITGDNMTGNLTVPNITVMDMLFFEDEEHFLRKNSSSLFDGIIEETFWFHHEASHSDGTIGLLVTANRSGQPFNAVMFATQVGRNNSAGILGNSWMVIPNNLTDNLSIFSDCFLVADNLSKTIRVGCDTANTGADFLVQDDIQAWGKLFVDEGIRSEGDVDFFMQGNDFDIVNGSIHLRTLRQETIGFNIGDNITAFSKDFDNGAITPFQVITAGGFPDWLVVPDVNCHDDECARALGGSGSPLRRMEANFSTVNISSMNLTFFLTTDLGGGDVFEVLIDNNTGSGEVSLFTTSAVIVNEFQNIELSVEMENTSTVTLIFELTANNINFDVTFVDNIILFGNATADTTANVTRFDTQILGGDGDGTVQIFYNDSTQQWIFLPGNVSFGQVTEVDLNVTNSITLDGETIFNWDNISAFDDNVLLRDGSRGLTSDWNQGNFNITSATSWFLGIVNWSSILNSPIFALASDVVSWISGNRTESETDMLGNISQVNTTANIERLNFTQGNHTIDTNLSAGGISTGNINISSANFTMSTGQFICLSQTCDSWIKYELHNTTIMLNETNNQWIVSNQSGVFIQG